MTERIAFVPAGAEAPVHAVELGRMTAGAWVACGDAGLLACPAGELLWLSRPGYEHAVRRLGERDVAQVVARRRSAFAAQLPSRAPGELFGLRLRVAEAAARAQDGAAFERSLAVLAELSGASRFLGVGDAGLLGRLLEREQRLCGELESPEGSALAAPGEREARVRLADETAQLLARLGQPEYAQAPLYVALVRGYLLVPAPAELIAQWRRDGVLAVPWRGGAVGPLRAGEAQDLRPLAEATLMFAEGGQAAGLQMSLTPAQLAVELADREGDVQMARHVSGLRVALAAFRRNAAGLVQDRAIAAALARQLAVETPIAMVAMAARRVFLEAGPSPSLADTAAEFAAAGTLLAGLVVRHGIAWQRLAAELLAVAKGG